MPPPLPKISIGLKADQNSIGPQLQAVMQAEDAAQNGPAAPPMPVPNLNPQFGADPAASDQPFGMVQEDERALLPPSHSTEIGENQPAQPVDELTGGEMNLQAELGANSQDPQVQKALEAMYGAGFPLLDENSDDQDWVSWAKQLWSGQKAGVEMRLHLVERNRLMRRDIQWVSSQGMGPWREPPKPKDSTRAVDNMIKPALDQRLQIVAEQRPGFRTRPETQDQVQMKKAEAQQVALEYQYDQQEMAKVIREACYWNGTDGVSFLHSYWNPERGPWDEVMIMDGQGVFQSMRGPMGDCETTVLRIEEVRVSPDASANKKPNYWVVKKVIPTQQAVAEYGPEVLDEEKLRENGLQMDSSIGSRTGLVSTLPDALLRNQPTVDCFWVYCEKSSGLPNGLTLKVVGNKIVAGPMPLLYGRVPIIRITDGSTDPNFYPEAIMEGWIDSQMRINVLKSKWIDSIRVNAGGRFLGKTNTLGTETLIGGLTSFIEIKGAGSIKDSVFPMQGFSVGQDVKDLLEIEKKSFEDKTGYNDTSRGSFSADQSGRAILAIREQLERAFAPPVNAVADAMTEWAKLQLDIMKWGYDYPRTLSVQGTGRPDLARAISGQDLDGVANVSIDPETLMPMPRALRLFLLDSLLQKGLITADDYKRRLPFAFTKNLDSADNDQYARAQRVVQAIKETGNPQALPMLWQDDEAIHQDAIERELILPDELPINHPVRQAALARWQMLAQQSMMKMGGMVPQQQPQRAGHGGKPAQLPPGTQPMQGTNPGIAAGTAQEQSQVDQGAARYEGALP